MLRGHAGRVAVAAIVVVAGLVGVVGWRMMVRRSWQARLAANYTPPNAARLKSWHSATFWQAHDRIMGDILQRPRWSTPELEELRAVIARPVDWLHATGPSGGRTEPAIEGYVLWGDAVAAIAARLATKAPIDDALRPAFESEITALLRHDAPAARTTGIAYVADLGLLDHETPARSTVESLRTDPDPSVAANAIRQLEWRDLLVKKGMVK